MVDNVKQQKMYAIFFSEKWYFETTCVRESDMSFF